MEVAFRLCRKTYHSKSISHHAKFKDYITVAKYLYSVETLASKGLSETGKKERTFNGNEMM